MVQFKLAEALLNATPGRPVICCKVHSALFNWDLLKHLMIPQLLLRASPYARLET